MDDIRETNPASNPELPTICRGEFVERKFDVKHVIRQMLTSRLYQLSSEPGSDNRYDRQNFARYYARRMPAEVFLDAVDQATGTKTNFGNISANARAVDLPHEGFGSYFLDTFDRPKRVSVCECERSSGATLAQVLLLANSDEIENKLSSGQGRTRGWCKRRSRRRKRWKNGTWRGAARRRRPNDKRPSVTSRRSSPPAKSPQDARRRALEFAEHPRVRVQSLIGAAGVPLIESPSNRTSSTLPTESTGPTCQELFPCSTCSATRIAPVRESVAVALRVGALAAGGLTLAQSLRLQAAAAEAGRPKVQEGVTEICRPAGPAISICTT